MLSSEQIIEVTKGNHRLISIQLHNFYVSNKKRGLWWREEEKKCAKNAQKKKQNGTACSISTDTKKLYAAYIKKKISNGNPDQRTIYIQKS